MSHLIIAHFFISHEYSKICNGFLCTTVMVLLLTVKTPFKPRIFQSLVSFHVMLFQLKTIGGHKLGVN